MSNDSIFDPTFEGCALAELMNDVYRVASDTQKFANQMGCIREWMKLTFSDALSLMGANEKQVEQWIDRFEKSFTARLQSEIDSIAGSATERLAGRPVS